MFHYDNFIDRETTECRSKEITVGDWVRSKYRAPWYGIIQSLKRDGCASVKVVLSRSGGCLRKPLHKILHVDWLTVIESPIKE